MDGIGNTLSLFKSESKFQVSFMNPTKLSDEEFIGPPAFLVGVGNILHMWGLLCGGPDTTFD